MLIIFREVCIHVEKAVIYQNDIIEWIEQDWGNELMIPVFGSKSNKIIKSYLIPQEKATDELVNVNFDKDYLKPGFDLAGDEGKQYTRFCNYEGIEPFVIVQEYGGEWRDNVELVEEFRLLFNLYFDRENNKYLDLESGDIVSKIDKNDDDTYLVLVHKKYLKRYLSVKGMAMILFVNHQISFPIESNAWKSESYEVEKENLKYDLCIGTYVSNNFSLLNAKKIIYGCKLKDCGIWPYDKEPTYIEFIVGADEDGNEKSFTCNPGMLNNMANIHSDAPHYLTPVFFRSSVLDKYYEYPEMYKVEDGYISCGGRWCLYIDNQNVDNGYVSAYLGDLGRDLPNIEEQHHWRSHNILIDGKLSESKFKRDFLAEFAEPESIDLIFRNEFININQMFEKKMGWKLFIDLNEKDSYNFNGLRIPTNDTGRQFDILVLSLVKVIIDSINEKEIIKQLRQKNIDESNLKGSISKLEKWFEICGFVNYEPHIKFLRNLQELRSSGTGHRKGKNYEKICATFGISNGNYKKVFIDILNQSLNFLRYIKKSDLSD